MTLWDARTYCRKCVEEVSPALYDFASAGGELSDVLNKGDISAFRFIASIGKWYLLSVLLIFGVPFLLLYLAGNGDLWGVVFVLAFFGGGGMIFLSIVTLLAIIWVRSDLPRKLSVEDGHLIITTPNDRQTVPITDCKWFLDSTSADAQCMFTGLRRGVVIQTPDSWFAVGHEHTKLEHWQSFLSVGRITRYTKRGCLTPIAIAGAGLLFGLLAGCGIGYLVSTITNHSVWPFALGFLGAIEGAMVALMFLYCTTEGAVAARSRLNPFIVGLMFFVLGFKFGLIGGWPGALVCGGINSVFGVFVAWLCRAKIDAAELERQHSSRACTPRRGHRG
ncbi:MAG: hypothetical protein NXI22_16935 [bacterium]|nr:hypothetical protein [bacterium]